MRRIHWICTEQYLKVFQSKIHRNFLNQRQLYTILLLILLSACSSPTPVTGMTAQSPSHTPTPPPTTTQTPEPLPAVLARPAYSLTTTFDYDRHFITVDETLHYPNQTGESLGSLTMAIAANLWPNCFQLKNLTVDDRPVTDFSLSGHRLDVPLPAPLASGSTVELNLRYSLFLPYTDQTHSLRARIFGYGELQTNLTNWYPFIVPFIDGDWVLHEPWSHGEYLVYPLADFSVDLKFTNPDNAPIVAASGAPQSNGEYTRYTLTEGRAFALSASRDFQVTSLQVGEIQVSSYFFPIYKRAGEGALIASKQAIEVFSRTFGTYPHKTLSIVVADFMDSMEYSALYFNSRSFYDQFDGTPQNYLTFVSVHETAHQWWFEGVANDQAIEPWLDESLATYSESIYYETLYPDLLPWWWSYRIDFFNPSGFIDIPVYQGQNDDIYKNTVYFNGAHFLRDLREIIGDEAFYTFLSDYFHVNQGRIVSKAAFFRALDEHTQADYSDILRGYFRY
jgi:hypothetical protein